MEYYLKRSGLFALGLTCCTAAMHAENGQPNIVLFMVDDMGWQDTSVPFYSDTTAYNRMFYTPNMERLAEKGVKFTQAYATPVSSPSRCSLFTGANAARHKVTTWTLERDKMTDNVTARDTIVPPDWNYNGIQRHGGINNTFVGPSFVQELKDNGYHTIHIGKAHLGALDTPGENPHYWGFDVNVAGSAAGGLATYLSERRYGHDADGNPTALNSIPDLEKYWDTGTFATEALTQEALKNLDKAKKYGAPWFLYMSHFAVHVPIDRDVRFYQKHLDRGLSPKEAAYASLVEGMDKSLGDILDWIENNGEEDNTIVIFMSDNGGLAAEPEWRDGEIHTQNSPLRSGKGSVLEGGIREPMIVYWPGHSTAGSAIDDYLIIEDFYPTILEMAGIENSSHYGHEIDGESFAGLIEGTKKGNDERALIWNFPNIWGNEGPGINLVSAIRKGDYKLIYHYDTGEKELYNVNDDISELNNLTDVMPELTQELSKALGDKLRSYEAQRPVNKITGAPCPWPDEVVSTL